MTFHPFSHGARSAGRTRTYVRHTAIGVPQPHVLVAEVVGGVAACAPTAMPPTRPPATAMVAARCRSPMCMMITFLWSCQAPRMWSPTGSAAGATLTPAWEVRTCPIHGNSVSNDCEQGTAWSPRASSKHESPAPPPPTCKTTRKPAGRVARRSAWQGDGARDAPRAGGPGPRRLRTGRVQNGASGARISRLLVLECRRTYGGRGGHELRCCALPRGARERSSRAWTARSRAVSE